MMICLFMLATLCLMSLSNCALVLATQEEMNEINDAFNTVFTKININNLFIRKRGLRTGIVKRALEKYYSDSRDEFMKDSGYSYSIFGIIDQNYLEGIYSYLDEHFKMNLNHYIEKAFLDYDRYTEALHRPNMRSYFDQSGCTPLQFAVALDRFYMVREMVNARLEPKLQLDMPHRDAKHITARAIARKIYDPVRRNLMLTYLHINKKKHDLTLVTRHLKGDLTVTVKQGVLENDMNMVESSLLLGNFGDKTDVDIIGQAMLNENFLMLEALVMEGYAIPEEEDRPSYSKMNSSDVDFILNQEKGKERPLPNDRFLESS